MIKFSSLFSGSSGNSIFLSCNKTKIIIDAGLSGIKIINALKEIGEDPGDLSAIVVTHEHIDHIKGAGVLSRKFDIPIYANRGTWEAMQRMLEPVAPKNMSCFRTGEEFSIGDICINSFPIPHDASEPVGLSFFSGSRKITIATDIGHMNASLLKCLEMSDLLLLESNHDEQMLRVGPYPWPLKKRILGDKGHLSNEIAGKVVAHLAKKGTRKFLLGHLSRENNFPELAYQTEYNALLESRISAGDDVFLGVVLRDKVGEVITI